jgi:succinoglycan biosynthesis transport protein ExoP
VKGSPEQIMDNSINGRKAILPGATLLPREPFRSAARLETVNRTQIRPISEPNQLNRYWAAIVDHKLLVLLILTVCTGAAAIVALSEPASYRARTSIELLGLNANFLNLQSVDPTGPIEGGSSAESYTQTQLELLKSEGLIARAVKKTHLDEDNRFLSHSTNSALSHVRRLLAQAGLAKQAQSGPQSMSAQERLHAAIEIAQKRLRVQQVHQSNLVEITFDDTDPKVALDFVNAVAQEAVDENMESRWNLSRNVGDWLGRHLTDLRGKMDLAEKDLLAYTASAGLLSTNDGVSVDDARLQRLQDQLSRAQADRIQKETRNTVATMADPQSLPEVLDDPALKDYRVRLADLRRQEAEMSSAFTPAYPKAKHLQAQIAELESTIANERTNIRNRIRNEYSASKRNEDAVVEEYTAQSAKVGSLAQKTIHYNTLKRELETTRSMYEDMLKRVNDTELASVVRSSGIRVVDAATFPEPPSNSKAIFICSIGLFAGLLIAGTVIFVLDQTSSTLRSPGFAPALLSVMELGIIPSARKSDRSRLAGSQASRVFSKARPENSGAITLDLQRQSERRAIREREATTSSLFDDSFRSSINSILFALDEGSEHRVIAVSSPGSGDGKTTIAANLGSILADIGNRVLLIDADLRKPTLHTMFGIANGDGLSNLLSSEEPISIESVQTLVRRPANSNLDVLTAGEPGAVAFDLFQSKRIAELIEAVRKDYNLILIDTAPLLLIPESRTLGRLADWSILVLRAGRTTEEAAIAARQQMVDDGIPLLGTILNDCKRLRSAYGYSY